MSETDTTAAFEAQRPRLVGLATRMLGDAAEAQDVVQQAWLRLHATTADIESLPAWLTTVTSRLCLDRLRARIPEPVDDIDPAVDAGDPTDDVVLAESVGLALQVVLDRLTPRERVAFVLHDSFGLDFDLTGRVLDASPAAARKLASRARGKVSLAAGPDDDGGRPADWQVVDAFLAAAKGGELARLLELLAPDAVIAGDEAAVAIGTPTRIAGRAQVADFFDGAAATAFPVFVAGRPGAAWFDRGVARVAFDFTVTDGLVRRIDFRAEPGLLAQLVKRADGAVKPTR